MQYLKTRGITLLSKQWDGYDGKVDIICTCGHAHKVMVSNLVKGHHDLCSRCAAKYRARNNANTEEDIKCRVRALGCQLLGKYEGWKNVHSIRYGCGHVVNRILAVFFRENRSLCPTCYKTRIGNETRPTIEEIREIFANRQCKLLTSSHQGYGRVYEYVAQFGHKNKITLSRFAAGEGDYCRECIKGSSAPQKYILGLVETKLHLHFEEEYKITYNGHNQRIDMLSANKRIALEYDGLFHFKNVKHEECWDATAAERRDTNKNEYCQAHGISLIRIDGRTWTPKKLRTEKFDGILQESLRVASQKNVMLLIRESIVECPNYQFPPEWFKNRTARNKPN